MHRSIKKFTIVKHRIKVNNRLWPNNLKRKFKMPECTEDRKSGATIIYWKQNSVYRHNKQIDQNISMKTYKLRNEDIPKPFPKLKSFQFVSVLNLTRDCC